MLELDFNTYPILETDRLILREPRLSDQNALFALRSDVSVMKYLDRDPQKDPKEALDLLELWLNDFESLKGITWMVEDKEEKKMIGTCGFWKIDRFHHRAQLGYILAESHQGKGLMREAIVKSIEFAFNIMKAHSIEAFANPNNERSLYVLKSLGFVKETYMRENYNYNGRFLDTIGYGLLQKEFIK